MGAAARTNLNPDWLLQSSAAVDAGGAELSSGTGDTSGWYRATLPATVLGALVEAGEFEDPFFGTNLLELPGQGPAAENFSNHPMPEDSPFAVPWWFVKRFTVPAGAGPYLRLQLDGVNYRADIWLNGELIADRNQLVGAYRDFELDVTAHLRRDGENWLAVEVFPPGPFEVAITWVDWNPSPPDKNMGLWRDAWLRSSGPVALDAPHVVSTLDGSSRATITIGGDLRNWSDRSVTAFVTARFDGQQLEQQLELGAGERRRFDLESAIEQPRLWWPRALGDPALYDLEIEVTVDGARSDADAFAFGVREIKGELSPEGHAQLYVNGEPLLIRGAGWATDMFLRRQPERDRAQYEYVKALNLDTIRFEGMLERAEFLEWCDRDGIMVIAGWCCCDAWEKWDQWSDETHLVAAESLRRQLRRVRRHPCMISWWYGSDFPPPPAVEQRYLDIFADEHWPNAKHSSAAAKPTELTGPSGMKMEGPYDYVPPGYWFEDTERGGAFGFATEICPGPAVPPIESLERMLPAHHLWPIDEVWNFHAGGQEFHNIVMFADAVKARFGEPGDVARFAQLSQLLNYETQRAMFEAYTRNRPRATGVIQWMLNNSWPSLIWHLFDWYLRPGGGFFATRKACEPLHAMYCYDDGSVVVTNATRTAHRGVEVWARVFDLELTELFAHRAVVDVPPLGGARALVLPTPDDPPPVRFVDLRTRGPADVDERRNFYWLPARPDVLDHAASNWINTPVKQHADLTSLAKLPPATVEVSGVHEVRNGDASVRVDLRNPTDRLAFFVELRLADERGADLLPIHWDDNYFSLLPGDTISVAASFASTALATSDLYLHVSGINVPASRLVFRCRKERSDESNGDYRVRSEPAVDVRL